MNQTNSALTLECVRFDDNNNAIIVLDQTLIPFGTKYLTLTTQAEIWEAIYELRIRGAPAIGITAAFGLYLAAKSVGHDSHLGNGFEGFYKFFLEAKSYLATSHPTAVNLFWAVDLLDACVRKNAHLQLCIVTI